MFVSGDSERLNNVRQHQSDIRDEHYSELQCFGIQRAQIHYIAVRKMLCWRPLLKGVREIFYNDTKFLKQLSENWET